MDTNIVVIEGRLTRNAEMKQVGNSTLISFSIANNQSHQNKETGEWINTANFFECDVWNRQNFFKHLQKGRMLTITGHLKQETWTGTDGKTNSRIKIIADSLSLRYDKKEVTSTQVESGQAEVNPAPNPEFQQAVTQIQSLQNQQPNELGFQEDSPF